MNMEENLTKLKQLYLLHDELMGKFPAACKMTCASCCTGNVTLTSLEGKMILNFLSTGEIDLNDFIIRLNSANPQEHFIPKTTFNELAELCMKDEEPPEEEMTFNESKCAFLEKDLCLVYPVRPLACRALVSAKPCIEEGFADMPSLALSLNNLFMQFNEELDATGFSGNLSDLLPFLMSMNGAGPKEIKQKAMESGKLIANRKIPVLMIPPQDFADLKQALRAITDIVKFKRTGNTE